MKTICAAKCRRMMRALSTQSQIRQWLGKRLQGTHVCGALSEQMCKIASSVCCWCRWFKNMTGGVP